MRVINTEVYCTPTPIGSFQLNSPTFRSPESNCTLRKYIQRHQFVCDKGRQCTHIYLQSHSLSWSPAMPNPETVNLREMLEGCGVSLKASFGVYGDMHTKTGCRLVAMDGNPITIPDQMPSPAAYPCQDLRGKPGSLSGNPIKPIPGETPPP